MVFDISQIRKIRKQLNLTQHQFAQKIGISQSMIAKIEAGKLDPTYSYVKKIEQAIDFLSKSEELKAEEIMHRKVISVSRHAKVKEIADLLIKNEISQVPVIEKNIPIGLVTESSLLVPEETSSKTAEDVMIESPPILSKDTKISVIKPLLLFYPIVLIKGFDKIIGVITKADMLKTLA